MLVGIVVVVFCLNWNFCLKWNGKNSHKFSPEKIVWLVLPNGDFTLFATQHSYQKLCLPVAYICDCFSTCMGFMQLTLDRQLVQHAYNFIAFPYQIEAILRFLVCLDSGSNLQTCFEDQRRILKGGCENPVFQRRCLFPQISWTTKINFNLTFSWLTDNMGTVEWN